MTDIPLFAHFFFSLVATVGFGVFFNSPVQALAPAGITGGLGWCIYIVLMRLSSSAIFANFVAAIFVSWVSEYLARKMKHPAILFVIPGIIPLVPGIGLYNTMLYLVQGDYTLAISTGADTLFISGAISLGVLVITSLSRTLFLINLRKKMPIK